MKRISSILAAIAATSLVAAPAMAAPVGAQSLSVAKSARVSAPAAKGERLGGGGGAVTGILIAAGIAAIAIIAAVNSDDDSDSN